MNKKIFFLTLISILFFPFALMLSNYIVLGTHLIHNYINGTDTPFKAEDNYIYVLVLFSTMILLYVFFLSRIIVNISSEIRYLSNLLRDIAKDQNYPDPVNTAELRYKDMKYLSESINILIDQLQYNQSKYEESEEFRKRYLDQLSHDIKTPLSIIKINLYYLKTKQNTEEAIQEINKNTDIIATLSDRIYHKNDLNADSIITYKKPINLEKCVSGIVEKWHNALNHKNITYWNKINSDTIWELDKVWFERLIDNILQNVLYHSEASQLTIESFTGDKQQQLVIRDNGIGFNPTKKLQQSDRKGLNIIHEVPKLLNLHLSIDSNGLGTNITLTYRKSPHFHPKQKT
ncbi:HAMP domain-containing histidine kinase [Virgibacillus sp. NKC19-3]|uniref:sensor histidine kinase n=1 Tax=Virgibacillus saliphilus TaxID=2831674 RepID=UPI001C9B7D3C|nr:HAMP domain-containing sensor histidine kinase [Virgibacillus sp. NKC19-3]MBY7142628.1 HAMP domain-containing histidine kinase [Virgibacillus sp. NKC19-3]